MEKYVYGNEGECIENNAKKECVREKELTT
jgi:hypothetical protein